MATILCSACQNELLPTQKYCPHCGTKNEIAFLILNATSSAVPNLGNPASPRTPLPFSDVPSEPFTEFIDKTPTEIDIYQAAISQTNPYAPWGGSKPIVDDSIQHIWEVNDTKRYSGTTYCIQRFPDDYEENYEAKYKGDTMRGHLITLLQNNMFRNFAYQAQVTVGIHNEGGLIFRASSDGKLYYLLEISGSTSVLDNATIRLRTEDELSNLFVKSFPISGSKSLLLGVVAQNNVIDVYCNLEHVQRVSDATYLSPGLIGVCAFTDEGQVNHKIVKFSYAKVWVNDEAKDERGKYD